MHEREFLGRNSNFRKRLSPMKGVSIANFDKTMLNKSLFKMMPEKWKVLSSKLKGILVIDYKKNKERAHKI